MPATALSTIARLFPAPESWASGLSSALASSELKFHLPFSEPVPLFAVSVVLILAVPLLFEKLRLPGQVGLLVAGVLFGPNALGVLDRSESITLLGTIGLLYIIFVAGLELDMDQFIKHRNKSIGFGALTFLLPQVAGTAAGLALGLGWIPASLLGAVLASHTLLPYPIASRLGLGQASAVTTAVGATIIAETASLLVLAVGSALATGGLGLGFWVRPVGTTVAFTAIAFWGLPKLGRWFFRHVAAGGATEFLFVLASAFACAYLAELAGVEPIIGAFVAGLTLNRLLPHAGPLMNRVVFVGEAIFIPFFLLSTGMLIDLAAFDPRHLLAGGDVAAEAQRAWMVSGVLVFLGVATKWVAAVVGRRVLGYSPDEGRVIFGLTVAHVAAALAVALVGYELDLFDAAVLNGTILMILVTCVVGPWVTARYGRRMAQQLERDASAGGGAEPPPRILVPLANPATAEALMDVAMMIRPADSHEPVYPLTVASDANLPSPAEGNGDGSETLSEAERRVAAAERMLGHAVVHAAAAGVPVQATTRVDANVANGIIRALQELRIYADVIGWNGHAARRSRVFGTVLDQVLDRSAQMTLVCRIEHPLNTTRRVILAVPPFAWREPGFEAAARAAKRLAKQVGADAYLAAAEGTMEKLGERLERVKPELEFAPLSLPSWGDLLPSLARGLSSPSATKARAKAEAKAEARAGKAGARPADRAEVGPEADDEAEPVGEDDLLILLAARNGRVSWRAALDRLPRQFSRRFPQTNFVVIYPPELAADRPAPLAGNGKLTAAGMLAPDRVALGVNATDPASLVERMVARSFGTPDADRSAEEVRAEVQATNGTAGPSADGATDGAADDVAEDAEEARAAPAPPTRVAPTGSVTDDGATHPHDPNDPRIVDTAVSLADGTSSAGEPSRNGKNGKNAKSAAKSGAKSGAGVREAVVAELTRVAEEMPVEITPGVVLLHVHSRHVDEPTLFLATTEAGAKFPKVRNTAYVVFALLSPRGLPPERHLAALASIGRVTHDPDAVPRLHHAEDLAELQAVIGPM